MILLQEHKKIKDILNSGIDREELQQIINILGQRWEAVDKTIEQHSEELFMTPSLLLALLHEKWSKSKLFKLLQLREVISMQIRHRYDGNRSYGEKHIDILPVYRYFDEYMLSGCLFFCSKRIPFEEWEDLAKEQVDILKILIAKNQLKNFRRTKLCNEFADKYDQREVELVKKGYTQLWDGAYR